MDEESNGLARQDGSWSSGERGFSRVSGGLNHMLIGKAAARVCLVTVVGGNDGVLARNQVVGIVVDRGAIRECHRRENPAIDIEANRAGGKRPASRLARNS